MKTCVILPAFNEGVNISKIIRDTKTQGIDVIVVDDGSQDDTSITAEKEGAVVIRHDRKKGKGRSLRDGFEYAANNNYDVVVTMDADGQHDPAELKDFIKRSRETDASVVVGNRLVSPKGMPLTRFLTNKFMSLVISAICRQNIPDTQCGYRLFRIDALKSIKIEARKFEIESELLIKLSRKGYRVESVPIRTIYAGETSQINPVIDTFRFIRFIMKILREG